MTDPAVQEFHRVGASSYKPADRQRATVRLTGRHFDHTYPMGDGPAQIGDESGGWEEVERPDDVSMTIWRGGPALRMTVPILLDGWRRGRSVEERLDSIRKLVRTKDGDEPPPTFIVRGPVPVRGERWVLDGIEYGDALRGRHGELLRQALTLNLLQFNPADRIRIRKRHQRRHRYTAKGGDTCLRIANRLYDHHVEGKAREIAKLNEIRGIRTPIKAGTRIRLP